MELQNDKGTTTMATTTSLLERLRQEPTMKCFGSLNGEEATERMKLMVKHQSEFPSRLRPEIIVGKNHADQSVGDSSTERVERVFASFVFRAVKDLFFGGSRRNDDATPREWYGIDSDVDTEDQVELTIRLFPDVLVIKRPLTPLRLRKKALPILFLTSSSKAVSFVPLFFGLSQSAGNMCFHEVYIDHELVLRQLLNNTLAKERFGGVSGDSGSSKGEGPSCLELDEASLVALKRLRVMGLVNEYQILNFFRELIVGTQTANNLRSPSFWERRCRLLIDFDPTILRRMIPSRRNAIPLLTASLESFPVRVSLEFWIFELFSRTGNLALSRGTARVWIFREKF